MDDDAMRTLCTWSVLLLGAISFGCNANGNRIFGEVPGQTDSDIDELLHKGMNEHEVFTALGVTHRWGQSAGSLHSNYAAYLCERYPNHEVFLMYQLGRDGWELSQWELKDKSSTTDWIPTDAEWAEQQVAKMARLLEEFAAEEAERRASE